MTKVSKQQPLHHYIWGEACDGWNLVDTETLSIKQERMPAGTSEQQHYHKEAQQFFFVLKGTATFEINGESVEVNEQEGIHIQNGIKHRIMNNTKDDLEFILSSQPSTKNDRINL
jgi:mannose-6-phosphate isomerase-like protein (cupin superfamily)